MVPRNTFTAFRLTYLSPAEISHTSRCEFLGPIPRIWIEDETSGLFGATVKQAKASVRKRIHESVQSTGRARPRDGRLRQLLVDLYESESDESPGELSDSDGSDGSDETYYDGAKYFLGATESDAESGAAEDDSDDRGPRRARRAGGVRIAAPEPTAVSEELIAAEKEHHRLMKKLKRFATLSKGKAKETSHGLRSRVMKTINRKFAVGDVIMREKVLILTKETMNVQSFTKFEEEEPCDTKVAERWTEYSIVLRRSAGESIAMQLYRLDDKEAKPVHEYELTKEVRANFYSFTDKTLSIAIPRLSSCYVHLVKFHDQFRSFRWLYFVKQVIGDELNPAFNIHIPAINMSVDVTVPESVVLEAVEDELEVVAEERGYRVVHTPVVQYLLDAVWRELGGVDSAQAFLAAARPWFCFRFYDRLEWVSDRSEMFFVQNQVLKGGFQLELRDIACPGPEGPGQGTGRWERLPGGPQPFSGGSGAPGRPEGPENLAEGPGPLFSGEKREKRERGERGEQREGPGLPGEPRKPLSGAGLPEMVGDFGRGEPEELPAGKSGNSGESEEGEALKGSAANPSGEWPVEPVGPAVPVVPEPVELLSKGPEMPEKKEPGEPGGPENLEAASGEPREPREFRESEKFVDSRDFRDSRESREPEKFRESEKSRAPEKFREFKGPRESGESGTFREPGSFRDFREPGSKDFRESREPGSKEARGSREPGPKEPREPGPKEPRGPGALASQAPLPIEGFLSKLTDVRGDEVANFRTYYKVLYFSTSTHLLFFCKYYRGMPPRSTHELDGYYEHCSYVLDGADHIPWLESESFAEMDQQALEEFERRRQLVLRADSVIDLATVTSIRPVQDKNLAHRVLLGALWYGNSSVEDPDSVFEITTENAGKIRLQAPNRATRDMWVAKLLAIRDFWNQQIAVEMQRRMAVRAHNMRTLNISEYVDSNVTQELDMMETRLSVADQAANSIDGLTLTNGHSMSGFLYQKYKKHSNFNQYFVVLSLGSLVLYSLYKRSKLTGEWKRASYFKHFLTIPLSDCYVYSGAQTGLDLLDRTEDVDAANPSHKALPRIYHDGWRSQEEESARCFALWFGKKRRISKNRQEEPKNPGLVRIVRKLGITGQSIVFMARSRQERELWVSCLYCEIDAALR